MAVFQFFLGLPFKRIVFINPNLSFFNKRPETKPPPQPASRQVF
jgi:hypothetical protein